MPVASLRFARFAAAMAPLLLAACSSSGSSGTGAANPQPGSPLANLLIWGSTTVPPAPPLPVDDEFECPPVSIAPDGAAYRVGGEAVRVQYSMNDVARECTNIQRDGSFTLKVGVEGRVLLGAAGSAGRYDVSVRFLVKDGERVVASRAQRQSVTVPAGAAQGAFSMVEQGIQVPPGLKNLEIEVGFGAGGGNARRRSARR